MSDLSHEECPHCGWTAAEQDAQAGEVERLTDERDRLRKERDHANATGVNAAVYAALQRENERLKAALADFARRELLALAATIAAGSMPQVAGTFINPQEIAGDAIAVARAIIRTEELGK